MYPGMDPGLVASSKNSYKEGDQNVTEFAAPLGKYIIKQDTVYDNYDNPHIENHLFFEPSAILKYKDLLHPSVIELVPREKPEKYHVLLCQDEYKNNKIVERCIFNLTIKGNSIVEVYWLDR